MHSSQAVQSSVSSQAPYSRRLAGWRFLAGRRGCGSPVTRLAVAGSVSCQFHQPWAIFSNHFSPDFAFDIHHFHFRFPPLPLPEHDPEVAPFFAGFDDRFRANQYPAQLLFGIDRPDERESAPVHRHSFPGIRIKPPCFIPGIAGTLRKCFPEPRLSYSKIGEGHRLLPWISRYRFPDISTGRYHI